jgi:hypothetical protein
MLALERGNVPEFNAVLRLEDSQALNLCAARALAFAASSSRFLGAAPVSSERSSRAEIPATSSTEAWNAYSFAFEGLVKPHIFLTNCKDAARISSSVTGGSKLKRVLIYLHMGCPENILTPRLRVALTTLSPRSLSARSMLVFVL